MDLTTAIEKRRSIRKFLDKPLEPATVGGILEIAKHAPSSGNAQNWRFVIVTDPKIKTEIVSHCAGQTWIDTAPILIIVCSETRETKAYSKKSELFNIQNTAIITTLIMLKATELGLGTCWVGSFDEEAVADVLKIPTTKLKIHAILPIGYPHPDEKHRAHKRLSIDKLTWFDRYGRAYKIAKKVKKPFSLKKLIRR